MILTFESVDTILRCEHSIESFLSSIFLWYCLLCCTKRSVYQILKCGNSNRNYLSSTFPWYFLFFSSGQYVSVLLLTVLCKVVQAFESVDKILNCDHSNESC